MNATNPNEDEENYNLTPYIPRVYDVAKQLITEYQRISTPGLQRRLSSIGITLGFSKVATLLERMEADGLVGPVEADNKRRVHIAVQ